MPAGIMSLVSPCQTGGKIKDFSKSLKSLLMSHDCMLIHSTVIASIPQRGMD